METEQRDSNNVPVLKKSNQKNYACKELSLDRAGTDAMSNEVGLIRKVRHQHIVHVVDAFMAKKNRYKIILEPLATCDLRQYLRKMERGPSSKADWAKLGLRRLQLLQWMRCLAVSLQHMHSLDVRHRDIKPDNILIHGGNILFTDFGTSFHSDKDTRYTCISTPGTAKYLPPEASGNRRFGRSGDIYSLGCVFFFKFFIVYLMIAEARRLYF